MPRSVSAALLEQVAELRAQGYSWETISGQVRRSVSRLRRWPREYAARWSAALARAEADMVRSAAAESLSVLRSQLREKELPLKQKAAELLLRHDARRRTKTPRKASARAAATTPAIRLAEFVEGLSDDDLDALLGEMETRPAGLADAEGRTDDSTGAAGSECVS